MTATTNTGKPRSRNWRKARKPVQIHEITEGMLAHIRQAAERSLIAQTVWPSKWYGKDFLGTDCLLVSMACPIPGQPPPTRLPAPSRCSPSSPSGTGLCGPRRTAPAGLLSKTNSATTRSMSRSSPTGTDSPSLPRTLTVSQTAGPREPRGRPEMHTKKTTITVQFDVEYDGVFVTIPDVSAELAGKVAGTEGKDWCISDVRTFDYATQPIGFEGLSTSFDHIGEALDAYDDGKIDLAEFLDRIREQVGERAPSSEGAAGKLDFEAYKQRVIDSMPPKKFIQFPG